VIQRIRALAKQGGQFGKMSSHGSNINRLIERVLMLVQRDAQPIALLLGCPTGPRIFSDCLPYMERTSFCNS